ncbi:hypothetical protein, partial [Burkholderia sp. SRS-W-2-2016]|uniref:hypothetical protein n=1 Tax=Burkholderia sp. SRS-W-2-2016 TaxID=1926878 RepID=UPI001C4B0519
GFGGLLCGWVNAGWSMLGAGCGRLRRLIAAAGCGFCRFTGVSVYGAPGLRLPGFDEFAL